ncbi:Glycosyl hydrolase family 20, domain 2 [Bryocella elongata]|uniref:beta-N-acetylhexosaminidase n=1 Tax=Bryocella elongata TaxID=863522 RepID=A0A1H6C2W2_9BACT|nr:glycoside hydrolase family 20 zincin-like fold domain-containing protein [Bryocella elongata]SEG67281.1 Glycosyl hydrolase family 20, domain 2 [Bryocella elongata]
MQPSRRYTMPRRALALLTVITAAGATNLASAQQPTAPPVLLPAAQQASFSNGSLPLCELSLQADPGVDPQALNATQQLLQAHCNSHPTVASLPLHLVQKAPGGQLPGINDAASPSSREAYRLSISRTGVTLTGNASAGLFYAVETLTQLLNTTGTQASLPFAEISDLPSLPYRGFMMDISHGAIPTVAEVERQLDLFARFKANQYFFYVETDLDLRGYPLLHKTSNWSAADIREIVAYAAARHIDVVPCVELFGHLHDLFRTEQYSDESALPHGGEANPADPKVQKLLDDWLEQYAALFPSPWLHIGFDEPFELERAHHNTAGTSPGDLWLQHLHHLAAKAAALGKRPLFWADIDEGAYIFNKYPGLAAGLPKNAIAAPWFYDARSDYSGLLDLFAANHVPIVVASGISDWDNIAPDFDTTFINIDGMLAAGRKAGAIGLLNTMWSDSAQAIHREADAAIAYGAAAAWQSTPMHPGTFFAAYAHTTSTAADAPHIAAALTAIAQAQSKLRGALGSETSFRMWDDPFHASTLARVRTHRTELRDARLAAESALEHLAATSPEAQQTTQDLQLGARMLDFAAMKFEYAIEIADNFDALPQQPKPDDISYLLKRETSARNHSRVGDLLDLSGELEQDYSAAWLRSNKPFRLATAQARWRAEQEYWRRFQASVWTVCRDFKPGDPRPTLTDVLAVR